MVPFDSRSPFLTSGIRLGTPAITTRGLKENNMQEVAQLIDDVLQHADNENTLNNVKGKVNALMTQRPLFDW
jgi:glycine hydroxymethyltransferase